MEKEKMIIEEILQKHGDEKLEFEQWYKNYVYYKNVNFSVKFLCSYRSSLEKIMTIKELWDEHSDDFTLSYKAKEIYSEDI